MKAPRLSEIAAKFHAAVTAAGLKSEALAKLVDAFNACEAACNVVTDEGVKVCRRSRIDLSGLVAAAPVALKDIAEALATRARQEVVYRGSAWADAHVFNGIREHAPCLAPTAK